MNARDSAELPSSRSPAAEHFTDNRGEGRRLNIQGVIMLRNEADILAPALNHAAHLFDKLTIVDAQSTDGTLEILKSFALIWPHIKVYSFAMQEKYQAVMMNAIAPKCFAEGADWVFLLDGDEFINVSGRAELERFLRAFPHEVMHMPWINLIPQEYGRFDSFNIDQTFYWSGRVSQFNKVAISSLYASAHPTFWIFEGNHDLAPSFNHAPCPPRLGLTLLHLPLRSRERLKYRLSNALRGLRSKHNSFKGEGSHVEKTLNLLEESEGSEEGLNAIAATYGGNHAKFNRVNPCALDWPRKRLPNYITEIRELGVSARGLTDTVSRDAKVEWKKPQFVKGSAVKAELDENEIRIIPQPLTGNGDAVTERYRGLPVKNPALPQVLGPELLINAVAASFVKIRAWTFSAWQDLVPALFSIFAVLRPRRFVELGVHNGMSFFSACQISDHLGLQTQCIAVDTWLGDAHASFHSREVFDQFVKTLKDVYPQQHYIESYFSDALACFDDGSIDLLHIDGFHSYDAVKQDFETWLPKMSQVGVVIFHDTNVHTREFGVWRFWAELKSKYPSFELAHCHGLGIAYVGTQPNIIAELLNYLECNVSWRLLAQQYLESLGELAVAHRQLLEEKIPLTAQVAARENQINDLSRTTKKHGLSLLRSAIGHLRKFGISHAITRTREWLRH